MALWHDLFAEAAIDKDPSILPLVSFYSAKHQRIMIGIWMAAYLLLVIIVLLSLLFSNDFKLLFCSPKMLKRLYASRP